MAVQHPFRSFFRHFWQQARRRYLLVLIADLLAIIAAVYIMPVISTQVDSDRALAHSLYGIVWFAIGLLVFLLRPSDLSSVLFNLMGVGLFMQELELGHNAPGLPAWIIAIVLTYSVLNSAVVLHFLTVFPKLRRWRWWLLGPFYVCFALHALANELKFFGSQSEAVTSLAGSGMYLYPVMNLTALALILYSYFSSHDPAVRKRLRWTLTGGAIALIWQAATVNLPRLFGMTVEMQPWIMQAGLFAAPAGIAIGLVWYNTFDIDLFLSRTLVYGVVIGLVVIAYEAISELLVFVVGSGMSGTTSFLISMIATLAIAAAFDPVRDKTQELIDGWFFRVTGDERLAPETHVDAVRNLVEKHGGELELVAESDDAAEFTLRLPNKK